MDDNYLLLLIEEASLPPDEEADFLLNLQAEVDRGELTEQEAEEIIDCLYAA